MLPADWVTYLVDTEVTVMVPRLVTVVVLVEPGSVSIVALVTVVVVVTVIVG